jgi:hypothetical protein
LSKQQTAISCVCLFVLSEKFKVIMYQGILTSDENFLLHLLLVDNIEKVIQIDQSESRVELVNAT